MRPPSLTVTDTPCIEITTCQLWLEIFQYDISPAVIATLPSFSHLHCLHNIMAHATAAPTSQASQLGRVYVFE